MVVQNEEQVLGDPGGGTFQKAESVELSALGAVSEELAEEGASEDAELWVRRLGERAARLDSANVVAMLTAAGDGESGKLARSLEKGATAASNLRARLARCEEPLKTAATGAVRGVAARAEASARQLLSELEQLFAWLEAPALKDIDTPPDLNTAAGRTRALATASALRNVLRPNSGNAYLRKLAATNERLKKLGRARDSLATEVARHINNLLIHFGNIALSTPPVVLGASVPTPKHHAELLQYAPFMRWLKDVDDKSYDLLVKVYVSTWTRVYERCARSWCEAARAVLAPSASSPSSTSFSSDGDIQQAMDHLLTMVETVCDVEQDFCMQFLCLDVDVKAEYSDGDRSEKSEGDSASTGGASSGAAGGVRRSSASRKLYADIFTPLEAELLALVAHLDKHDTYGSMRALWCASRHVLGSPSSAGGSEGRWGRGAAAAVAVAAKRAADRLIADTVAAMPDHVKAAQKRSKCGILGFVEEFAELSTRCEAIFVGGRRADLERWYATLTSAMMTAISNADHPRTPRQVIQLENYHRLHSILSGSALRVPSLEATRRETRARYNAALEAYVAHYFTTPLEKLQLFFEGVAEALAAGVKVREVAFRSDCSKQELKRVLALYPPHEVRKSLHRLYRTVEKHLSAEAGGAGGLLQVVWRAMQDQLLQQHLQLQSRMAECYPGAGLSMPLSTQDILEAFSDIAREH